MTATIGLSANLRKYIFTVLIALALSVSAFHAAAQSNPSEYGDDFGPANTLGTQSDSDMWRAIRNGEPGISVLGGGEGVVVMINAEGVWWTNLRKSGGPLITYGGYGLLVVVTLLLLFFLLRGRMNIQNGRSGALVLRFNLIHRVVHWTVAVLFMLLALTGLVLLFGRPFLIPLLGKKVFSVFATASMQMHNLFGPIFIASLLALLFSFFRGNLPSKRDIKWILKGGGMFGGHVSAGRYNAGEKLWFWTAILAGVTLSVSGILLSFPDALALRNTLHFSELAHAIAALIFIGFSLGHIYLGTVGTEGTLEGMVSGSVDRNWAKTHHDHWLSEMDGNAEKEIT